MQDEAIEEWTWKSLVQDGRNPWFIFLYSGSFGMKGVEYSGVMDIYECPVDCTGVHLKRKTKIMAVYK